MVKRGLVVVTVLAVLAVLPFRAEAHSDGVRCDEGIGPVLPLLLDGPPGDYVHCHDSGELESGEHWYTGAVYAHVPGLAHAGVCTDTDSALPANLRLTPFAGTGDPERQSMEAQGCDPASYIQVQDFEFDPVAVAIPPGEELRFKNDGPSVHTSTSASPVLGWNSGELDPGDAFFTALPVAGTFAYACTIHPEMTAQIWVVVDVAPASGTAGDTFTVIVSDESRPDGIVSDVQVHDQDGFLHEQVTGATTPTVEITLDDPGTYIVRARARDATTGDHSGWSPEKTIEVG